MPYAQNLGTGGSVLDALYGSTTSPTNSNAPLLLGHMGTNYLYLPGVAGNFALTATSAALQVTGNIEIVMRFSLDSYNLGPGVEQMIRYDDTIWLVATSGTFALSIRLASGPQFGIAGAAVPFSNGQGGWLRIRRTASTGAVQFAYATDSPNEPTAWTNLATTGAQPAGNLVYTGAAPVYTGSVFDPAGKFYRHIVRNGIGGPVVYDANFSTGITSGSQVTFTESSTNAATVTINRFTSGRKAVAVVQDVWLLGLDDYFEVVDSTLLDVGSGDSFTVIAVVRQWGTDGGYMAYVSKVNPDSNSNVGWGQVRLTGAATSALDIKDGSGTATGTNFAQAYASGAMSVLSSQRNGSTAIHQLNNNTPTTGIASTLSLANSLPMRIGANPGGTAFFADIECLGVAVWRRALSQAEIAAIAGYYGT